MKIKKIIPLIIIAMLLGSITYFLIPKKTIVDGHGEIPIRTLDQKINMAEVVITGKVMEKKQSKMSNEGKKDATHIPQTDYVVKIDSLLAGTPYNDKEVIVRIDGGEVGDTIMNVDYMPVFKTGEEVLLFLDIDDSSDLANPNENYYVLSVQEKYDKVKAETYQNGNEILVLKDLKDKLKLMKK